MTKARRDTFVIEDDRAPLHVLVEVTVDHDALAAMGRLDASHSMRRLLHDTLRAAYTEARTRLPERPHVVAPPRDLAAEDAAREAALRRTPPAPGLEDAVVLSTIGRDGPASGSGVF